MKKKGKKKTKVSPEEVVIGGRSSNSESSSDTDTDTGLFRFLHLKRRKLDKEILSLVLEPERRFIEQRYSDESYLVYMVLLNHIYLHVMNCLRAIYKLYKSIDH